MAVRFEKAFGVDWRPSYGCRIPTTSPGRVVALTIFTSSATNRGPRHKKEDTGALATRANFGTLDVYGFTVHNQSCGNEMLLASFRHKGLRQLHAQGNAKGVPPEMADKLRKLLFALETAEKLDQVSKFPGWKLHSLKGERKGLWSLTVTGNWRLVFRYDESTNTASELDLVDYH
jgi:proteic killer suppression protein